MKTYPKRDQWSTAVEHTICDAVGKCYPRNWDEDHITRSLLTALRDEHSEVTIKTDENNWYTKHHWDIYKNTKEQSMEEKHGDIGILVQLRFDDTKILEGVAFIEAKRMYQNHVDDSKSRFESLSRNQLARYCKSSSFHRTVLYDYHMNDHFKRASSFALPTRHLLTLDKDNREIYPYCEKLSDCLTNRYFRGYELDFDEELVSSVKGFLGAKGGVEYLMVAQSTLSSEIELNPELIEINRGTYKRFDTSEPDNTPTHSFGPGM